MGKCHRPGDVKLRDMAYNKVAWDAWDRTDGECGWPRTRFYRTRDVGAFRAHATGDWSPGEVGKCVHLRHQGYTFEEIAHLTGRTEENLHQALDPLEIEGAHG